MKDDITVLCTCIVQYNTFFLSCLATSEKKAEVERKHIKKIRNKKEPGRIERTGIVCLSVCLNRMFHGWVDASSVCPREHMPGPDLMADVESGNLTCRNGHQPIRAQHGISLPYAPRYVQVTQPWVPSYPSIVLSFGFLSLFQRTARREGNGRTNNRPNMSLMLQTALLSHKQSICQPHFSAPASEQGRKTGKEEGNSDDFAVCTVPLLRSRHRAGDTYFHVSSRDLECRKVER